MTTFLLLRFVLRRSHTLDKREVLAYHCMYIRKWSVTKKMYLNVYLWLSTNNSLELCVVYYSKRFVTFFSTSVEQFLPKHHFSNDKDIKRIVVFVCFFFAISNTVFKGPRCKIQGIYLHECMWFYLIIVNIYNKKEDQRPTSVLCHQHNTRTMEEIRNKQHFIAKTCPHSS